jgi:hypothetical protein
MCDPDEPGLTGNGPAPEGGGVYSDVVVIITLLTLLSYIRIIGIE